MAEVKKPLAQFLVQARRHLKKLAPEVITKNPYVAWSLFGTAGLAPILGYEAQRRARPADDETDIEQARTAVAEALNKQSDLASVLATEAVEQTLLRGLDNMRKSVRGAKVRELPGLPPLVEADSREEGDDMPESRDRPTTARKRMA